MRILLMAGNYAPEKTASAPITTDLCRHLAEAGHSVSVVTTFPHYPQWKIWKGYGGHLYSKENERGVWVRRVRNYIPRRPSSLKRVFYYASFGALAFFPACLAGRPDLILCVTPALELALSARALQMFWGVPYALWVKDLVPDIAIQTGMIKNRMAISLARRLEHFAYSHAARLIVLSECFAVNLRGKGVPGAKVTVLSDWVDTEAIRPEISGAPFRKELGIDPSAFVVLHSGNMGEKQKLELLIQAAKLLDEHRSIQFVIAGEGARKDAVVAEARRLGVRNVKFLPLQLHERFAEMLAAADVLLLHQHAGVTDSVAPSKLLTYMASGRPIVATATSDSEARRVISIAECGLVVEPEKPTELTEAILQLFREPDLRARMGASARGFACEKFSRQAAMPRLESLLYEIAGIARPATREGNEAGLVREVAMHSNDSPEPLA